MADADEGSSVEERRRHFDDREATRPDDPLIFLIPKRHVETWICSAIGRAVDERKDCKNEEKVTREDIKAAAKQIHEWARNPPSNDSTCIDSLRSSLPEWRKIC